jgi:hypothetical protein
MKYNNEVVTYNETLNERIIEQQSIGEKDKGMEWIFISYRKIFNSTSWFLLQLMYIFLLIRKIFL